MLCFWSSKGGVGCSVTAAATAIASAQRRHTLLVDLDGDQPAILGLEVERGVLEWVAADHPPPDALGRSEVVVGQRLSVLALGSALIEYQPDRWDVLARWLQADDRQVVVDCGPLPRPADPSAVGPCAAVPPCGGRADGAGQWHGPGAVLALAERSLLVTRACYLAVMAALEGPRPDGVVLVREPGRALGARDVADVVGAPVVQTVPWDPAISRSVDSGLLLRRLPRSLRQLADLVDGPDADCQDLARPRPGVSGGVTP